MTKAEWKALYSREVVRHNVTKKRLLRLIQE